MTTRPSPTAVVVAALLALGSAGLIGWSLAGQSAPMAGTVGPRLDIAVVPPVEREVEPGDTMEVGELSDGFDRAMLERSAAHEDEFALPRDAYAGDARLTEGTPRMPMPTPVDHPISSPEPFVMPAGALSDGSRTFGFDRPLEDFDAERDARRKAMDAQNGTQTGEEPIATLASTGGDPEIYTQSIEYSSE